MANKDKDLMMSAPRNIKLSASSKVFYVICYAIVAVIAVICLIPFLLLYGGAVDQLPRIQSAAGRVLHGGVQHYLQDAGTDLPGIRCIHFHHAGGHGTGSAADDNHGLRDQP